MSTSNDNEQVNRFSFQHFDQECDFGVDNEEGERVRKRKRPGRKPNPPSLQERRAQNRAAQKAFREREQQRKVEKEKQWQNFSREIQELKNQLAIVQFEAKYLKACVLHLTLSCLVHRGSVPHIWTESRIIPSNNHGEYKKPVFGLYGQHIEDEANQMPALLDMLLENKCVVDFDKALFATTQNSSFSNFIKNNSTTSPDFAFSSYQNYIDQEIITLNKESQEPRLNFPRNKKRSKTTPVTSPSQEDQLSEQSPQPFIQHPSPPAEVPSQQPIYQIHMSPLQQEDTQSSLSNNQALTVQHKPIVGVIFEPPSLKTSEDFVNMPSLQALHILRLQLKLGSILGSMIPAALLPTALQRVIPHDIRIDFIPSPSIRDRMIIFQDYFNIDDCFQFLTQKSVFIGGDVRDTRNWVVDPKYSLQFWFLSHLLVDQTYDDCFDREGVHNIAKEYMNDNEEEKDKKGYVFAERSTQEPIPKNDGHETNPHGNIFFREI